MHLVRPLILVPLLLLTLAPGCKSSDTPADSTGPNRADQLRMVAQGTNKDLQFKADAPGQIFVSNFTAGGDYLYQGMLKKGDVFLLPMDSSRAMINKEWVPLGRDTNIHDEYRLYYLNNP